MRFLVDAQLPPAFADALAQAGHDAEHVAEIGLATASDAKIWDRAADVGAIIVTKDADFAQRRISSLSGPAVVWIRLPNTQRQQLLAWFARILPDFLAAIESGEVPIEVV